MVRSSVAQNLHFDGGPYVRGMLGLAWFPSAAAQRNKENYEADLEWMVRKLYSRFTSSRVILQIASHGSRNVVIRPRAIPDPIPNPTPGSPGQDDYSRFYQASTSFSNETDAIRAGEDAPAPGKESYQNPTKGSGKGSDTLIEFNPGVYKDKGGPSPQNALDQIYWATLQRSDYVLLHELVHAMSNVSGVNATTMAGPANYKNLEEFTATVITNVYAAEDSGSTPPNLAGAYDNRSALSLELRDPLAFLQIQEVHAECLR
jgi:Effector protein